MVENWEGAVDSCRVTLQTVPGGLKHWTKINDMKFKFKCQILHQINLGEEWLNSSFSERNLGVLVDIKLSVESALPARRADCILGYIRHSITSQSKEVLVPLYSAFVWPHLECWVQCWAPQFIKDRKVLGCIQSRATKLGKGLEALSSKERLRTLGCCSLK